MTIESLFIPSNGGAMPTMIINRCYHPIEKYKFIKKQKIWIRTNPKELQIVTLLAL